MNAMNTFKKWMQTKPYIWLCLMLSCFVFFLVFNFGLDTFKNNRGLASEAETELQKGKDKLVVQNIPQVIEGKEVVHSAKPSPREQFLYGYLQGKYKAVYQNDTFAYITLKENQQALEFTGNRRQELIKNVQALFVKPGFELSNMKTLRRPASTNLSYEMRKKGELKGRFELVFSTGDELQSIQISEISH